jgi:hypothetical protein
LSRLSISIEPCAHGTRVSVSRFDDSRTSNDSVLT